MTKKNRKLCDKILLAKNHIDHNFPKTATMFLDDAFELILKDEIKQAVRKKCNDDYKKKNALKKVI